MERTLRVRLNEEDERLLAKLKKKYPGLKEAQITRLAWARLLEKGNSNEEK